MSVKSCLESIQSNSTVEAVVCLAIIVCSAPRRSPNSIVANSTQPGLEYGWLRCESPQKNSATRGMQFARFEYLVRSR